MADKKCVDCGRVFDLDKEGAIVGFNDEGMCNDCIIKVVGKDKWMSERR